MKTSLGFVRECENGVIRTQNGSLRICALDENIIRFDYAIGKGTSKGKEGKDIEFSFGRTTVRVDGENSLVSVLRDGVLVHGGRAGGQDTVIPQSQFRLLGSLGRFNFALSDGDRFFGLGDKAGSPDHRGKRLRLYNKDSLGYDASFSDPLYKSIPLLIKTNDKKGICCGLYFPSSCIGSVDLGKESPFYYSIDVLDGNFTVYLMLGDDYKDIISSYYKVTGKPAFPPLFSFGYLGSSMNYVEAYDAQSRMQRFFSDVEQRGLPCEGMYVSSGYLKSDEGFRHAFMWNRRKFPDPGAFIKDLSQRGYHLTFNIKPGILKTHPLYEELKAKGYFIKDNEGNALVEYFWGGDASFIDFRNPEAVKWWKSMLCKAYLDYGVEGIWNDNNEFEMEDPELESYKVRTLYPVLMAKASYELCLERNPSRRPWIYSRSGYAGMQRYARTWSGDNSSDFKTLKYNQFQGASLALSGVPFVGHDLGGFYGPEPSPELLVRCCQSAIFQSRFVIHSWRENDEPTEPWKFPEAFPLIREALEDHYRHMPYIYNEAHNALEGPPLERLLCLEYPKDPELDPLTEQFLFGPNVMKAPVLNEGQTEKTVHFPFGDDWYSPRLGSMFKGGETVSLDCPLDTTWYFYKVGSVVPRTRQVQRLSTGYFKDLELFVLPKDGTFVYEYYEDDGVSVEEEGSHNSWSIEVSYNARTGRGSIRTDCRAGQQKTLEDRSLRISLPAGFEGEVELELKDARNAQFRFQGRYI